MKNKISKILIILLVMMILIITNMNIISLAATDPISQMKTQMGGVSDGDTSGGNIVTGIDRIFYIIRFIGTGVSVIMCIWLGVKYMTTSVEEKAEVKKQLVPMLIGAILIFGTSNVVAIIVDFVDL